MIVKRSVTRSIAQALSAIVLLSLLSTGLALVTLSSSLRDAEAINLAGSLRMQSYRLAWDATRESHQLAQHLMLYQQTLDAPVLQNLDRPWVPGEVINRYHRLRNAWPQLQQKLQQGEAVTYQQQVAIYVNEIDRFVLGLQHYAELKMHLVVASSLIGVIAIVALALMTIRFTRQQVVRPLNALVTASRYIENGNFSFPPLAVAQENELKVLSQTFSDMAARLKSHYQLLESTVRAKTEDLTEANRTLSLLYESSQMLAASPLHPALFEKVLNKVLIHEDLAAIHLEGDNYSFRAGHCDRARCWQRIPLLQEDHRIGELRWQTKKGDPPETLTGSLASIFGRSIWIWQTQKQYQQMLLIEERATIARELHDSLAQALSFLRIQLTLLRRTVDKNDCAAHAIIADFDRALSEASCQLRELLTTFRLTIEQADLVAAMQAMIAPLQEQVDVQIRFDYQPGLESLEAQQQVHVLQIAREALINAIRHANARMIAVDYQRTAEGEHLLTITDDGTGIASCDEPPGHFGLTTMAERAARLSGSLNISAQKRGTQVALRFPPRPAHPLE
ncbi:nitrate/nitrite two-component system sensor histidine kinase NarQ [Pantoea sp. LMR881]|uniref:nitrate/nitrite two-component system sensor histidine kinase NarQ n=1 Tax=Pantoea sp. LMR881 TaxID=3014336 RepID=UPI0022AFD89F|nr:nitrate/nitrite two-component system sensor histidine kinase NarQ [Pantoea sp. LMR881]MCZ4060504.1 nitrate/nitrite two-component system sensor histidine kinase NarQ [Pantoea sp. LMR881]